MSKKTLAIILTGVKGNRLQPLTKLRAKPSIPFGSKYRIIDSTLTNCLHSRLRPIMVLAMGDSPDPAHC